MHAETFGLKPDFYSVMQQNCYTGLVLIAIELVLNILLQCRPKIRLTNLQSNYSGNSSHNSLKFTQEMSVSYEF